MGLLSRRRTGHRADPAPASRESHSQPAREVIRADTFAHAPEWAKVPPLAPLLPPMPWVSSREFGDSLVSWKKPELFIAPLGHSMSDSGPAGIVKGVGIVSPEPLVDATIESPPRVSNGEPLTLAIPPLAPADGEDEEGQSRRGGAADESDAVRTDLIRPIGGVQAASRSTADLLGVEPLVVLPDPISLQPQPNRLLNAPTPPEMELVQLPSTLLRGGRDVSRSAGPMAPATAFGASDGPAAPTIALQGTKPSAGAGSAPVAPLLGGDPISHSSKGSPFVAADSAEATGADQGSQPDAADLTLAATPPGPSAPRSGLGAPMADLPPTATSWDITTMSRAQQLRTSRAIIQNQIGSAGGPLPLAGPVGAASREGPGAARSSPSRRMTAGMVLPIVPLERLAPLPRGVAPADLPAAADRTAPLLSTAPLSSGETGAPGAEASPETAPERPPEGMAVRTVIGSRHGVDLSGVPVDRTVGAAADARQIGARGFTSPAGVVIPQHIGSLDAGPGGALLAHELTHVAQQVRLGPNLPLEHTPAGRMLEAEALSAEMAFSPKAATRSAALPRPAGDGVPPSAAGMPMPLAAPTSLGSDQEALAASIFQRLSGLTAPAPGSPTTVVTNPSWGAGQPAGSGMPGPGIQRAAEPNAAPSAAQAAPAADAPAGAPSGPPSGPQGKFASRPSDEELSNLTQWIYPLISYRLKGELREGRERAGLVTDHYRRW